MKGKIPTQSQAVAYRKQVMISGIVYQIAANSAFNDSDIEEIIKELQTLFWTRQNIPF